MRHKLFVLLSLDFITDGELWAVFYHNVVIRGPESVKVSNTKGHATDGQIEAGTITTYLQLGNKASDEDATFSLQQHDSMLHSIAPLFY